MPGSSAYLPAIASDILSALQIAGASSLQTVLQDVFKKRKITAAEILIEELKAGEKDIHEVASVDEAAAIVYRYARAAQEGTAKLNLRLLAKVIAGQQQAGSLVASDFLYYADIISSLKREEIILLGCIYRHSKIMTLKTPEGVVSVDVPRDETPSYAYEETIKELVPKIFSTKNELIATADAIMRTGFLLNVSGYGGLIYQPSPLLDKLNLLISIDDALAKENIKTTYEKTA